MSDAKFTQGPWHWFTDHRGSVSLATPDRGRLYVMDFGRKGMQGATPRFSEWNGSDRGRQGGIMLDAVDYLSKTGVIDHPDAHLIAAAPDMYEALKGMLAIVDDSSGVSGYHLNGDIAEWAEFEEVAIAVDALAKARGES